MKKKTTTRNINRSVDNNDTIAVMSRFSTKHYELLRKDATSEKRSMGQHVAKIVEEYLDNLSNTEARNVQRV